MCGTLNDPLEPIMLHLTTESSFHPFIRVLGTADVLMAFSYLIRAYKNQTKQLMWGNKDQLLDQLADKGSHDREQCSVPFQACNELKKACVQEPSAMEIQEHSGQIFFPCQWKNQIGKENWGDTGLTIPPLVLEDDQFLSTRLVTMPIIFIWLTQSLYYFEQKNLKVKTKSADKHRLHLPSSGIIDEPPLWYQNSGFVSYNGEKQNHI